MTVGLTRSLVTLCALASLATPTLAAKPAQKELRVCADPNNLPFSDRQGRGFENELAELLARELAAKVAYTWAPQRRGFLKQTLLAGKCDVVMGVPVGLGPVSTSHPYYRSRYVFVSVPGGPQIASLGDLRLRNLRIGVPLVGDDGANPPPVLALAQRGLIAQLHGYSVWGDYSRESPPAELIRALRRGEIDVAIAWGPLAGFFSKQERPQLELRPIPETEAPAGLSFAFEIAVAVRHSDAKLLASLDGVLARRKSEIERVLARYGARQ